MTDERHCPDDYGGSHYHCVWCGCTCSMQGHAGNSPTDHCPPPDQRPAHAAAYQSWREVRVSDLVPGDLVWVAGAACVFKRREIGGSKDSLIVRLRRRAPLYVRWDAVIYRWST